VSCEVPNQLPDLAGEGVVGIEISSDAEDALGAAAGGRVAAGEPGGGRACAHPQTLPLGFSGSFSYSMPAICRKCESGRCEGRTYPSKIGDEP
jgi:hypothetical protein